MKDWGRLLTAIITPFDSTGVNFKELARIANHLVDTGTTGVVVAGTTGESPTLTHDEKLRCFEVVKEAIGDRGAVVAGTGSNNTQESIQLTMEAEERGMDGAMLVSPYYNKPSQEGLYQHFAAVAAKTRLPIIIYNIQGRTAVNIETVTLLRMAEIGNIVAVKEASGSISQISEVCEQMPEGFRVYSGDDALTLPLMAVGGYGIVSVIAHVAGREISTMLDHFLAGRNAQAIELHKRMNPLIRALFCTVNPVPIKEAMGMIGFDVGPLRLPMVPLTNEQRDLVRKALQQFGKL
jgi:4-hydroxy-tetrahydrodipicolinate synthase